MKSVEEFARDYPVTVHPDGDGGFIAHVPDFPGVLAGGDTPAEALASAYDGVASILAVQLEDGDPIPTPSVVAA